jgi:hypothetical protein
VVVEEACPVHVIHEVHFGIPACGEEEDDDDEDNNAMMGNLCACGRMRQ